MVDLAKLAKGAATSRTLYGGISLFAMLVGNVRIKLDLWIFDSLYHFEDANLIAAAIGLVFVFWGRAKAAGPLLEKSERKTSPTVEPSTPWERPGERKGFPREARP